MEAKEKAVKILLIVALLVGISGISIMMAGEQRAGVGSFFGPNNTNEIVLQAQTKLADLGLYDGRLSGLFGWRTKFAIYRFQEINNLSVNGILDIPTQKLLFYTPPEIEYLSIPFTDEGNKFLDVWIMSNYGNAGQPIKLSGELSLAQQEIFHQDVAWPLQYILVSGEKVYALGNISEISINEFINKPVSITGFILEKENNLGFESIAINHLTQI